MKEKQLYKNIPIIVLTASLFVLPAGANEKIQYKLNLEKGQSYYVRIISDSNVIQEMTGNETVTQASSGFGYSFDVNEVDEKGNGWVDCTIDWVKLDQKSPTMDYKYDSAEQNSPVPPEAQSVAIFLGERFTVKISPQGHVEDFKDIENLSKKLRNNIPEGPDKEQMLQYLQQEQIKNFLKERYFTYFDIYPDKPVGIGDSWSRIFLFKMQPFITENKWTLKEQHAGTAIIEENSIIKSDPNATQNSEFDMKVEMSGTGNRQIEIQESTGQILSSKTIGNMSGQIQAGPKTLLIKTHGVTTFEMTKVKPKKL